jgi:hypothetical protein
MQLKHVAVQLHGYWPLLLLLLLLHRACCAAHCAACARHCMRRFMVGLAAFCCYCCNKRSHLLHTSFHTFLQWEVHGGPGSVLLSLLQ